MARGLTLSDFNSPEAQAQEKEMMDQALTAGKRNLSFEDIHPSESKDEAPFADGSTLKVTVPLPGNWPEYDTGVSIGPKTAQVLAGAGKRFVDLENRYKQAVNKVVPGAFPGIQDEIDHQAELSKPLMGTTQAMLGYGLPDMAASMGYAGTGLAAIKQAGALGALSGAANPTSSSEPNGTLLNTGYGAIAGVAGQGIGNFLSNVVGKALHAAPNMIPNAVRNAARSIGIDLPSATWADPEKRRLFELARANNVPLTIGDLDPSSNWAQTENSIRPFWSGRNTTMQNQQDATRHVLNDLVDSIATVPEGTEGAVIAKGIRDKYKANKDVAGTLFDDVDSIAGRSPGLTPVKPKQTYIATRGAISDYPDLFDEFKNQPQIKKILGLQDDTGPQAGLIINPKTNSPFKYDQELNFSDARFLRKRLGAWYDKLSTQLANGSLPSGLDGEAVKHAADIYSAFNRDLDAWGSQPGNTALNNAWTKARNYYKNEVMPYRDADRTLSKSNLLRDITNGNVDVDSVVDKALPVQERSIAKDIMDHSTPAGQAGMKSALIRKIIDPATNPDLQGLGNTTVLRNTSKYAHTGDYVFSPDELQRIENAHDIARLTRRSAEANTTPPATGARTLPFMAGSALLGTAASAYMGLGMLGDSIDPATRILLATTVAPAAALGVMRGANRYTSSALGQNLHFAEPSLKGALGIIQEAGRRVIRCMGEPLEYNFTHGALGHRPSETED